MPQQMRKNHWKMQSLEKQLEMMKMNFEPFKLNSAEAIRGFLQKCFKGQKGEGAELFFTCIKSLSKNIGSKKY